MNQSNQPNQYQRSEAANQQPIKPVQPAKGPGATQADESINGAQPDELSYEMIPSEEVASEHRKR